MLRYWLLSTTSNEVEPKNNLVFTKLILSSRPGMRTLTVCNSSRWLLNIMPIMSTAKWITSCAKLWQLISNTRFHYSCAIVMWRKVKKSNSFLMLSFSFMVCNKMRCLWPTCYYCSSYCWRVYILVLICRVLCVAASSGWWGNCVFSCEVSRPETVLSNTIPQVPLKEKLCAISVCLG